MILIDSNRSHSARGGVPADRRSSWLQEHVLAALDYADALNLTDRITDPTRPSAGLSTASQVGAGES
jgi:hypothetical protein